MSKTIRNVLALVGVGALAGFIYWIGFFNGMKKHDKFFNEACSKATILKFKDDPVPYLCLPPPKQRRGAHKYDSI